MLRKFLLPALAATVLALTTTSRARAWGVAHVGYTHVGPSGVYHYGRTAAVGPYGAYSGGRVSGYGAYGGAYHAGYSSGYRYSPSYYGGYHYGGFGGASLYGDRYRYGVYRRW